MSSRVGLWVGETFAETHALSETGQVVHTDRWFQSKKTLLDGLKEAITATGSEAGEVYLASSRAESVIERRRGSSPTVLTTAGFESTLFFEVRNPVSPALRLSRPLSVLSNDRVFGIEERVGIDGKVEREVKTEELEFLKTKLELMKSRELAIQFVNSDKNPQNEVEAAKYFRSQGFKVFEHHLFPDALLRAYVEHVVHEEIDALRTGLTAAHPGWTIRLWSGEGLLTEWTTGASALGGMAQALARSVSKDSPVAFFGLEGFTLFRRDLPPVNLPVQPTCQIGAGAMPFPTWTGVDRGFEPGPMLLGKSHQLSLLDVLFVRGHLESGIDGFSDRVQEKSQPRIHEALYTLGKSLAEPGRKAADPQEIASDLERSAAERIACFLRMEMKEAADGKPFLIAGPLGNSVAAILKKVRPGWPIEREGIRSVAEAAVRGAVS